MTLGFESPIHYQNATCDGRFFCFGWVWVWVRAGAEDAGERALWVAVFAGIAELRNGGGRNGMMAAGRAGAAGR